ncbi:hypothetical protein [Bacteroides fluxus]|uniref:hypothetical protein n=1 Tax=Bacteroides fluxus TaxID=626930 RepID=UPI003977A43C
MEKQINYRTFEFPKENATSMENQGEIILYQPNSEVKLEVRMENETVVAEQVAIG